MGTQDPISADPDDAADAERLRAFFAPEDPARRPASGPGSTPPLRDRPPPRNAPIFPAGTSANAPLDPSAPVDGAALIPYLDAQMELTRRKTEEGFSQVLDALRHLEARVTELETFRTELFDWLEGYVAWEAATLDGIGDRLKGGPPPARPS